MVAVAAAIAVAAAVVPSRSGSGQAGSILDALVLNKDTVTTIIYRLLQ